MTSSKTRKIYQALNTDSLLGLTDIPLPSPLVNSNQHHIPSKHSSHASPSPEQKQQILSDLNANHVKNCSNCPLSASRTNTVFGEGNPDADLLFIGEGPGADEDAQGRPFVGRSGKLLDKQIAAMGLTRSQIYIANIVKCRPPANRAPTPDEAFACAPFLETQINTIQPKVIVTLGATAAKLLLNEPSLAITKQRGTLRSYHNIHVIPTFHPAYLLRQYTTKNRQDVWSDLKKAMQILNLPTTD